MIFSNPYSINIHSKAFWNATVQQMVIDSGSNLGKCVTKTTSEAAEAVFAKTTYNMPIVFDRSNCWGDSKTSLIDFSGLSINSHNTTVTSATEKTTDKKDKKDKDYTAYIVAAGALLSIGVAGLGICGNRFQKFQTSYNFFSALQSKEAESTNLTDATLETDLITLTRAYLDVSKIQMAFYDEQFYAAFGDVIGAAIMLGGALYAAPEIITLGGLIILFGALFGIYSYCMHWDDNKTLKGLYESISENAKNALLKLRAETSTIIFPKAITVALGKDEPLKAPEPSAPPEEVEEDPITINLNNYFEDPE